jgi:hypothetical protein
MAQQAKPLDRQIIPNESRPDKLEWLNHSMNMDLERKLYSVQNPEYMGTRLKGWLGLTTDNADHRFDLERCGD